MTDEKFEELQAIIDDLRGTDIEDHLSSAASCETKEDFIANLDSAITSTTEFLQELKMVRSEIK